MLEVRDLEVSYGAIKALHGVSLTVRAGEIVTLIGANGAGKSTLLRTISGLVKPVRGSVVFEGVPIAGLPARQNVLQRTWACLKCSVTGAGPAGGLPVTSLPAHQIVRLGLGHVPEGRMVFANLTVHENLLMGAYLEPDRQVVQRELELVFGIFPRLQERHRQLAGTLSGGEQQMLAIGRALMGRPRFLMLDEPSLGIAPLLVKTIFAKIVEINRTQGITILLVEQNANLALEVSQRGYVLETGGITLEDESAALRANPAVRAAYLGG